MKHLQSFNERQLVKNFLYKDEKLILTLINRLQTKCNPKKLRYRFFPEKKFIPKSISDKIENFFWKNGKIQEITFFTTLKENVKKVKKVDRYTIVKPIKTDEEDFFIANVKIVLFYDRTILTYRPYLAVSINDLDLECSDTSKSVLYSILCNYIDDNKL